MDFEGGVLVKKSGTLRNWGIWSENVAVSLLNILLVEENRLSKTCQLILMFLRSLWAVIFVVVRNLIKVYQKNCLQIQSFHILINNTSWQSPRRNVFLKDSFCKICRSDGDHLQIHSWVKQSAWKGIQQSHKMTLDR